MEGESFTIWLNEEPVSTSSICFGAGVAGISNLAAIPYARQRCIGAPITLKPLVDTSDEGYRVSVLQSSDMGYSVYSKLGFQEHCKIGTYIWAGG